jgi:hypothetical protein
VHRDGEETEAGSHAELMGRPEGLCRDLSLMQMEGGSGASREAAAAQS